MIIKFLSVVLLPAFGAIAGCAAVTMQKSELTNNNLNSTLWIQSSSEYKANSIQTFNSARNILNRAQNEVLWTAVSEQGVEYSTLPTAIILDIDETVLDNSPYQAQLVLNGREYDYESWDKWVALKSASAVPGSVDFINYAQKQGIEIFYITNRACAPRIQDGEPCPQEQDTIENLRNVGITGVTPNNTLLKKERPDWTSEKGSRRKAVTMNYRVIMLVGDDLGDFLPDVKQSITTQERDLLVAKHKENWGTKWFTLANPTYGSWLSILESPKSAQLRGVQSAEQTGE